MDDRDLAWKIEGYIDTMHSYFNEAAMVLELFIRAQADHRERFAAWTAEQHAEQKDAVSDTAMQKITTKMCESPEDSLKHLQAWHAHMIALRRQKWASGEVPMEYSQTLPRLYARSFLFSVWTIGRMLDRIARCDGVPEACRRIAAQFWAELPGLKGMRDSSAHVDERVDGMARGKKIETRPVDGGLARVPGNSIMFIENLVNDTFVGTAEDGSLAEIEVSPKTMAVVQQRVQTLINAFSWRGVGRLRPES
jgi:hypothetical protein